MQWAQLFRQKFAISSNEFAIEINLAAAIIRSLDADHVPMDLAAVAIISFFISLARSEMKRGRDFLVKQDIAHRLQNTWIKCKRKFADVAGAGIRIENFVELLRFVACCIDNLAITKFQLDSVETSSLINTRRVERDLSLN